MPCFHDAFALDGATSFLRCAILRMHRRERYCIAARLFPVSNPVRHSYRHRTARR
jgi:hypothetical protein